MKTNLVNVVYVKWGSFRARGWERGHDRGQREFQTSEGRTRACFGCGAADNMKRDCPHSDKKYRKCGCLAQVCRLVPVPRLTGVREEQITLNAVCTMWCCARSYSVLHLCTLGNEQHRCLIRARSGFSVTITNRRTWLGIASPKSKDVGTVLRNFLGHVIKLIGTLYIWVHGRGSKRGQRLWSLEEGAMFWGEIG